MTTKQKRNWYAVTTLPFLALAALLGWAVLSMRPSNATSLTDDGFSTATVGEHSAAAPATVGTTFHPQVEPVTASTFEELVLHSSIPVLVDFYADWCGPCQIQGRILEDFAAQSDGFKIVKVNVDQDAGLASQFQVEALPTLLVFRDGRVIARHVGMATKVQLSSAVAD